MLRLGTDHDGNQRYDEAEYDAIIAGFITFLSPVCFLSLVVVTPPVNPFPHFSSSSSRCSEHLSHINHLLLLALSSQSTLPLDILLQPPLLHILPETHHSLLVLVVIILVSASFPL